jgi:hypothetical protein
VYLDHPRPGGDWSLVDSPAPHEVTENYWRFRFPLPPGRATKFVVKDQQPQSQSFGLAGIPEATFASWFESRFLDRKIEKQVRESFAIRRGIADTEEKIKQLQAERDKIHAEQKRIRENLGSLGDRPSEKELRERFVRTLSQQEDRLERLAAEEARLQGDRDAARARLNDLIGKLDYEAEVPAG